MSYVLLIEDNPLNAEIEMILLQAMNLEVKHAARGLDGAHLARQERPCLILMDFDLPDIDGRTLALTLHGQLGGNLAPPIVAVTARIGSREERLAKHFGCAEFISKPIVAEEFTALIQRLLATQENTPDEDEESGLGQAAT